ncbi:MAG TPA: DUF5668 domain-containing protein [Candidatus Angelobacter sp.]|nr:DUF5668 domain-containing protein [Candidatus Angelobacter sp.]
MNPYVRNRSCSCVRCRCHGLMGAAILITLGVLFLLDNFHVIPFDQSFPILFLVIGSVLLIGRTGSTEGHIDPNYYAGTVPPPIANPQPANPQQQWTSGVTPPPPMPPNQPTDPQVKP